MQKLKRFIPLVAIAIIMALVFAKGWHKFLTLEAIAGNREALQAVVTSNRLIALVAYIALYAFAVALSLPGGLVLTLSGGLLFGWVIGGTAAVVGATLGATIVFLIARTAFGEHLAQRAGPWLEKLQDGFRENALSYLLFLRLVPAFPFWLVNLAPALLGVPLRTYVIGTSVGIIPGTMAFASVGAGLDSVIAVARAEHAACVASKGAATCVFTINTSALVNKQVLIAFALLGVVALLPVAMKRWGGGRDPSKLQNVPNRDRI